MLYGITSDSVMPYRKSHAINFIIEWASALVPPTPLWKGDLGVRSCFRCMEYMHAIKSDGRMYVNCYLFVKLSTEIADSIPKMPFAKFVGNCFQNWDISFIVGVGRILFTRQRGSKKCLGRSFFILSKKRQLGQCLGMSNRLMTVTELRGESVQSMTFGPTAAIRFHQAHSRWRKNNYRRMQAWDGAFITQAGCSRSRVGAVVWAHCGEACHAVRKAMSEQTVARSWDAVTEKNKQKEIEGRSASKRQGCSVSVPARGAFFRGVETNNQDIDSIDIPV